MNDLPLSPIDRQIDTLGNEDRIHSEEDARTYINALLEKFRIDENRLPNLSDLKSTLARAEFSAVLHTENRIPEAVVSQVFNQLMDEWQMPPWTRVSVAEFHAFRVTMSLALYPNSVARLPDGNLSPTCRPVEALYLVYLLHSKRGIEPELRDAIKAGRWPSQDPQALPAQRPAKLGMAPKGKGEGKRLFEYKSALDAYLSAHPNVRFQDQVQELFTRLGIH